MEEIKDLRTAAKRLVRMKIDSEKLIEAYLVRRMLQIGGRCVKCNSLTGVGYPDRICLFPGGTTVWVELKGKDGRLSKAQTIMIRQLQSIGHKAMMCKSKEDIDKLIENEVQRT